MDHRTLELGRIRSAAARGHASSPGGGVGDAPPTMAVDVDASSPVTIDGQSLSVADVVRVARGTAKVRLTDDAPALRRMDESCGYVERALRECRPMYGVTTGFGGMADVAIASDEAAALQNNMLCFLDTGAGKPLPSAAVRAAMLLRANSHVRGASGVRLEIVRRLETFLNANATPLVREFGSIGASGDLVPLAQVTGALIGADAGFRVEHEGEVLDCLSVLARLGLPRVALRAKEGLAMLNGTSVMTGIAALCVHDARTLLRLALGAHALFVQALAGSNQSFHPFIHAHKPHPGQRRVAARMLELLDGSRLSRDELGAHRADRAGELIQDRYSLRCLAQFLGPVVDGVDRIAEQVTVEMNSATDNPLIDVDADADYHGGNFLGQYIGVGMDHLRYYLSLTAKHLDAQVALLVSPEFNHGLPASLAGNPARAFNMGLKGLQITGNSLMPLLEFYGNSLADRFPTHAEQFNQNVNSQGFGSANLARQAIEIAQQYLAVVLVFGVQAVDLRTRIVAGHCDARECLSPATRPLYEAVREVVGRPATRHRPFVHDDADQSLALDVARIAADIAAGGLTPRGAPEL